MYFSSNLSYLRMIRNKTQDDMASEISVSQGTIANYEAGRREPSLAEVIEIARILGVSIDDLLTKDMRPAGAFIGRNLRYLRNGINAKAIEIAAIFGVNGSTYSKYENGLVEPKIDGLIAVSEFFGVTVDDLLKKDLSKEGEHSDQ